jgi:hypothetical protein
VTATIAACQKQQSHYKTCQDYTHATLHFL